MTRLNAIKGVNKTETKGTAEKEKVDERKIVLASTTSAIISRAEQDEARH